METTAQQAQDMPAALEPTIEEAVTNYVPSLPVLGMDHTHLKPLRHYPGAVWATKAAEASRALYGQNA